MRKENCHLLWLVDFLFQREFFFLQVCILLVHMSEFVVQWNSHETNSLETYEMCKCNTGNVFSGRCSSRFVITTGEDSGVFVI